MLRLQLADDAPDKPPLEASMRLLHTSCSCAFDLPRDSSTWDLSNLLRRPPRHQGHCDSMAQCRVCTH
jgi:hypothetical protein